jgi:AcrR family transcriptional regulator
MRLLVTRDDYHEAAMRILGNEGAGGLKIAALCGELGVTTGSFYGYFGSLDGFIEQFLEYWWESQTSRIAAIVTDEDDAVERIHLVKDLTSQLPHAAEGAIRSWGHTHPAVAAMQAKVDARRLEVVTELLRPVAASPEEARTLGVMAMTLLVGLQQWRQPVTERDFDLVFGEFEELVLSRVPGGNMPIR